MLSRNLGITRRKEMEQELEGNAWEVKEVFWKGKFEDSQNS